MKYIVEVLGGLPMFMLLTLAAFGVASGDYYAKLWSTNHNYSLFILALLGYLMAGFFYIPTLIKNGLVVTSVIYSILSIIAFLVIGLVVFNEILSTRQLVGVSLGVVTLIILSI